MNPRKWLVGADEAPLPPVPEAPRRLFVEAASSRSTPVEVLAEPITEGGRNATLTSVAGSLRRRGAGEGTIRAALRAVNQERCSPPLPEEEVARIAASVARYPAPAPVGEEPAGGEAPAAEIVTVPLSEVQPAFVDWLWRGWIPRGRLTLVAGNPGGGKSFLTQAIAAAVSVGAPLPGDDTPRDPASVILIACEDDPADTLRPRLEAMGADLSRVHVYQHVTERKKIDENGREREIEQNRQFTVPYDAGLLEDLIRRHGAALVILDPLVAIQDGSIDSHRQAAMRQVLAPLHRVAQETGAAIVVVAHLRKTGAETAALRVGGSVDLVAAARVVIVVAPDPEDQAPTPSDRRRVAAVAKSNIAAFPDPVAYTLREGRFLWDTAPVAAGTTAETLLETPTAGTEERGALEEAADFLREALKDGPRPAKEVRREAAEAGIKDRTLDRAKARLEVKAERQGFGNKGVWVWSLPIERH